MTRSEEKQKSVETVFQCPKKLDLAGKDIKAVMFKELKEIVFKDSTHGLGPISKKMYDTLTGIQFGTITIFLWFLMVLRSWTAVT